MRLAGRVSLITGGAQRIGRELALALARRDCAVAFTYHHSVRQARATAREIEACGVRALPIRTDLSKAARVRQLIARIDQVFGRLDILINSAANFDRVRFDRLTEHDWDRALDTNLKGPFLCALYASRLMRRQPHAKIINIADWAGVRPYKDYLPYCVSKAGVIGLTKALAKELAPRIRVVAIAPGPILPPAGMTAAAAARIAARVPLGRWGSPEDLVNTALFLLEGTDFMTGSTVFVDGGQLIA